MSGGRAHPEFAALTRESDDGLSPGWRRALLVASIVIMSAIIIAAIVFGSAPARG